MKLGNIGYVDDVMPIFMLIGSKITVWLSVRNDHFLCLSSRALLGLHVILYIVPGAIGLNYVNNFHC